MLCAEHHSLQRGTGVSSNTSALPPPSPHWCPHCPPNTRRQLVSEKLLLDCWMCPSETEVCISISCYFIRQRHAASWLAPACRLQLLIWVEMHCGVQQLPGLHDSYRDQTIRVPQFYHRYCDEYTIIGEGPLPCWKHLLAFLGYFLHKCGLVSISRLRNSRDHLKQCVGLGHGIMGTGIPEGGLLRYRKWVPQQLLEMQQTCSCVLSNKGVPQFWKM